MSTSAATATSSSTTDAAKKIDAYFYAMKVAINGHLEDYKKCNAERLTTTAASSFNPNDVIGNYHADLMKMVMGYEKFKLCSEDLMKRKRVKNVVPLFDRCVAKRANGEQCTRRKKEGEGYCGTHTKGRPHGSVNETPENVVTNKKVDVWIKEIKGIVYYIDGDNNVYDPEDILLNKINPKVIMKFSPPTVAAVVAAAT
jgi:hypothetical protein